MLLWIKLDRKRRAGLPRQAYFEYDAKKSGGVTISHLRFGPQPIYAPQLGLDRCMVSAIMVARAHLVDGWMVDADGCYTCYRWRWLAGWWWMMDDGWGTTCVPQTTWQSTSPATCRIMFLGRTDGLTVEPEASKRVFPREPVLQIFNLRNLRIYFTYSFRCSFFSIGGVCRPCITVNWSLGAFSVCEHMHPTCPTFLFCCHVSHQSIWGAWCTAFLVGHDSLHEAQWSLRHQLLLECFWAGEQVATEDATWFGHQEGREGFQFLLDWRQSHNFVIQSGGTAVSFNLERLIAGTTLGAQTQTVFLDGNGRTGEVVHHWCHADCCQGAARQKFFCRVLGQRFCLILFEAEETWRNWILMILMLLTYPDSCFDKSVSGHSTDRGVYFWSTANCSSSRMDQIRARLVLASESTWSCRVSSLSWAACLGLLKRTQLGSWAEFAGFGCSWWMLVLRMKTFDILWWNLHKKVPMYRNSMEFLQTPALVVFHPFLGDPAVRWCLLRRPLTCWRRASRRCMARKARQWPYWAWLWCSSQTLAEEMPKAISNRNNRNNPWICSSSTIRNDPSWIHRNHSDYFNLGSRKTMISIPGNHLLPIKNHITDVSFSPKPSKIISMMCQFLKFPWDFPEISRSADPGDKVVQMNIDGVDASVSGITECPVPGSWAEIALPGEVRTMVGDRWWKFWMRHLVKTRENHGKTHVKLWWKRYDRCEQNHKISQRFAIKKRQAMDVMGFGCEVLDPLVFRWSGWISSELQAGGSTQAAKGPRKILDLAPKQFADGVQQPCNNLDAWPAWKRLVASETSIPSGKLT